MIFTIKNNVPTISLEGVNIPEFKEIWLADESEDKATARKELAYVYHMASYDSSYAKLARDQRALEVKADYIGDDDWVPSSLINNAIDKYRRLHETELVRLLRSASNVADKLADYFDNVDFDEIDAEGKPVYDAKDILSSLSKLSSVVKSLKQLKEEVKKEQQANQTKLRGNVSLSFFDEENDI
jgi:hypothetical protein